jgi:hypothetical protein
MKKTETDLIVAFAAFGVVVCISIIGGGCRDASPSSLPVHFWDPRDKPPGGSVPSSEQLAALHAASAITNARIAYAAGDYRLVGVAGLALGVPGLDAAAVDQERIGVKIVSGTSDTAGGVAKQIQREAKLYALRYNRELLVQLTRNGDVDD